MIATELQVVGRRCREAVGRDHDLDMFDENPVPTGWRAIFHTRVIRNDGSIEDLGDKHNLRTNDGIDWQSGAMGGGPAITNTYLSGNATSTGATTLTNSGASFPITGGFGNTSTSPLAGKIVVAGPNSSGTGALVWGVIISNTATALTVDRWYNPQSPGGAAGSTPNGTCSYIIVPNNAPNWWMALTATAITPAATDHTLSGEASTNGFSRAFAAWSHTNGTATYSLANTYTCTGGSTTINGEATLNAQNSGIMSFEATEPSPPTLISGDTLAETVSISY